MSIKRVLITCHNTSYPVFIGSNLIDHLDEFVTFDKRPSSLVLISDEHVFDLYGAAVHNQLGCYDVPIHECIVAPGESCKSLDTINTLTRKLIRKEIDRNSLFVTLGGGTVSDVGGFISSIYMRGCPVVHIPTTLIGMCDAAIGGKCAVNVADAKNIIGSFWQPTAVLEDIETLKTLSERDVLSGLGEIFKYSLLEDCGLFERLEGDEVNFVMQESYDSINLIATCASIKGKFVEEDEHDTGARQLLNLGHTIGHAIESVSGFSYPHGICVATGIVVLMRGLAQLSYIDPAFTDRVATVADKHHLIIDEQFDMSQLMGAMHHDKKRSAQQYRIIIPHAIGCITRERVDEREMRRIVQAGYLHA